MGKDNEGELLPNQIKPAMYALDKILCMLSDCDSESSDPLELYLFDENGKLQEATALVWVDAPRLKKRCDRLGFGFADIETTSSGELLCRHSGLRRLAEMVREELIDDTPTNAPDDDERLLEALMTSAEFADCHVACCRASGGALLMQQRPIGCYRPSSSAGPPHPSRLRYPYARPTLVKNWTPAKPPQAPLPVCVKLVQRLAFGCSLVCSVAAMLSRSGLFSKSWAPTSCHPSCGRAASRLPRTSPCTPTSSNAGRMGPRASEKFVRVG